MTEYTGRHAGNPITLDALRDGPPTISVELASRYLGISRAFAYEMVRTGRLPVIRIGDKRVRVPSAALLRMLSGETATASPGQRPVEPVR